MAETIPLKDKFDIQASSPIPEYDSPTAKAFSCTAREDEYDGLMALLCDPRVPLRMDSVESLRGFPGIGLMKFVDMGVVKWTPTGRRQHVLIYERPSGARVFPSADAKIPPASDEKLTKGFLAPAIATIREMSQRGFTHRNIRPTNIFYSDGNERNIMLGECITAPPGFNQPIQFEALETAMADETARGEAGILDDLYALGVTLLCLLLGRDPLGNVEPARHIDDRIATGSYAVLVGSNRIQMNWMELLRGLLNDDLKERWSIRDVELWLGGRRLTPKQVKLPNKAARPLIIGGGSYDNVRSVAHAMGRNWMTAPKVVRGADFDNWLRRSLNDEVVVEAVGKVAGSATIIAAMPQTDDNRLVSRVAIGLDPLAPMRHKGLSAHLDGVGPTLAMGFFSETIRQRVADFVTGRFVQQWMSLQSRTKPELMQIYSVFERLPGYLGQSGSGFGPERVLYELNPHIHCYSPMIEHLLVTQSDELIPALEAVAQSSDRPQVPMDRHISAFLAARSKDVDDRYIRPLSAAKERPAGDIITILRILARVQAMSRNGPMHGLCAWIAELCRPAVDAYSNLKARKAAEASVERAVETGYLAELLKVVDDFKALERDENGYKRAMAEHQQCRAQILQLNLDLQNRENLASETGEQVAAVISGVVGSVGAIAIVILYLF